MSAKSSVSVLLVAVVFLSLLPPVSPVVIAESFNVHSFKQPIDAVSFGMTGAERGVEVSYRDDHGWSDWNTLAIDDDQDPRLTETDMLMLPTGVSEIRTRGATAYNVHPIRVSSDPASFKVAATTVAQTSKRILSRADWGADESILFSNTNSSSSSEVDKGDNGTPTTLSAREQDCVRAQREYPDEFRVASTVTTDVSGRKYRWPVQYSKQVRLFAVHHTALLVNGDTRSAVERMRALYAYHSNSRGWGDIGYNYVIDETGQIYEGRNGGRYAVSGHAYCNNVGSIGISLMGNFELEQPTQDQVKSLQWLIDELADTYSVNISAPVMFHGKSFVSPIAGHRDLVSTTCPGYYMYGALGQVIANVKAGTLMASVNFPALKKNIPDITTPSSGTVGGSSAVAAGLQTQGRTAISANPGSKQKITLSYTAGIAGARAGTKIADIRRSSSTLYVWQQSGEAQLNVSDSLFLPYDVPAGERQDLQFIVQMPMSEGSEWLDIGGIRFSFAVSGRRMRTGTYINPFSGNPALTVTPPTKARPVLRSTGRLRSNPLASSTTTARVISVPTQPSSTSRVLSDVSVIAPITRPANPSAIRIRLSVDANPTLTFGAKGLVADMSVSTGERVSLSANGNRCQATFQGQRIASDVLLFSVNSSNSIAIDTVKGKHRVYRGLLECRVVDGQLAVINELPLDEYMLGLSEEPDTEPYEKQRAFAIAARTYAAFYMRAEGANRKFPGKPYDGSDDPAIFQVYAGVTFEEQNPRWLEAVTSTAGQVLMVDRSIIKPPYFSSDDGRTRAPADVGWKNFPFAYIFEPKDDPWCKGMTRRGHGVGMSGCGAKGQALEGRSGEQILQYYYPGTRIGQL